MLGQAEVENLDPARGHEQHVGGFQIPVQHATFVRVAQRLRNLQAVVDEAIDGQADPVRHSAIKRQAIDEFHGDERLAVVFTDLVNGADVRMIQRGGGAGFAQQTGGRERVVGGGSRKDLDGDVALELLVVGAIHLAHPARSNAVPDSIVAEPTADHDWNPRPNWLGLDAPGEVAGPARADVRTRTLPSERGARARSGRAFRLSDP